jgi:regulator of protease activity HflC (stomatin/prohibitin superfamily)
VTDPYLAINHVANYQEALYLILQLNLRDVLGALDVDELLAKREQIGKQIFDRSVAKAAEIGLLLSLVNLKDIMFPGELKMIFAQVVKARKDGLAALERARGESAALRNLANAAKLLDGNPKLAQLRLYQLLENSAGNTVVLLPGENSPSLEKITSRRSKNETS